MTRTASSDQMVRPTTMFGAPITWGPLDDDRVPIAALVRREHRRARLVADTRRARLDVIGIARFAVDDGRRVTVDAGPDTSDAEIATWLFGTVAALLLGQQGRFALHASTVALPHTAVAVSGAIGSGKSTTSLALVRRGHRLVTDDVSALDVRDGTAVVEPFGRPVHVWPATYDGLGLRPPLDARAVPGSDKLSLPAPDAGPAAVGVVVVIRPTDDAATVCVDPITPTAAVRMLVGQAYRSRLVRSLWPAALLAWCGALAGAVETYEVARPSSTWTAPEVAEAVERLAATARLSRST